MARRSARRPGLPGAFAVVLVGCTTAACGNLLGIEDVTVRERGGAGGAGGAAGPGGAGAAGGPVACGGDGGGQVCAVGACVGGVCQCTDGDKNGAETAIDCGGESCGKCADGNACVLPSDCQSGECTRKVCAVTIPPSCQ